VLDCVLKRVDE